MVQQSKVANKSSSWPDVEQPYARPSAHAARARGTLSTSALETHNVLVGQQRRWCLPKGNDYSGERAPQPTCDGMSVKKVVMVSEVA
jgi:hypothetical protein